MTEEIVEFYLTNRNILIVNEPKNIDSKSANIFEQCIQLGMSISGVNPTKLSQYPNLICKLTSLLGKKNVEVICIEDNFLTPLINFIHDKNSVEDFMKALEKQGNLNLYRRFTKMLSEIDECGICLDEKATILFQCAHKACASCSTKIQTCPFCREHIGARLKQHEKKNSEEISDYKLPKFMLVEDLNSFLALRFKGFLNQTRTMNSAEMQELDMLLKYRSDLLDLNVIPSLKSEEVISFVLAKHFWYHILEGELSKGNWTPSEKLLSDKIGQYLKPSRLIRFLSVISGSDPVKDELVSLKLPNSMRKWLIRTVDNWILPDQEEEILQRKGFWIWIFQGVHVNIKKFNSFPTAKLVADLVRGNRKPQCAKFLTKFECYYLKKDTEIFDLLISKPSVAFRLLRCVILKFDEFFGGNSGLNFLEKLFALLYTEQLIELINIFSKSSKDKRVYRNKTGRLYEIQSEKVERNLPSKVKHMILNLLQKELESRPLNKPLIIEKSDLWENLRLNRGKPMKTPPWSSILASAGDKLKLEPQNQYILFIHWMQETERVDLDLSVQLFDKEGNFTEMVDYTNLVDTTGKIVHSGDITSAAPPQGASEFIAFCPDLISSNYERILVSCFSFTGVVYDKMEVAYVGVAILDTKSKGLGPNGSHILSCSQLRGDANVTIVGSFDLRNNLFSFMNVPMKGKSMRNGLSVSSGKNQISSMDAMYHTWLETRGPPTYKVVIDSYMLMVKIVVILENGKALKYEKEKNESSLHFIARVASGKGLVVSTIEAPSICFINEEKEYFSVPSNSIAISKKDPFISGVRWNSDPYSVLNNIY